MKKMRMSQYQGAASIEMTIALIVLIPIFLVTSEMVKIGDMNNSVIQGSRYLAWETTVSTVGMQENSHMFEEVNNRLMSANDQMIQTRKTGQSNNEATQQVKENLFWRTFRTTESDNETQSQSEPQTRSLAKSERSSKESSDVKYVAMHDQKAQVRMDEDDAPGVADTFVDVLETVTGLLDTFSDGDSFAVNKKGLYDAQVGLNIGETRYLKSVEGKACGNNNSVFCMRRSNVILADTWAAGSPDQAAKTTQSLVPTRPLKPIAQVAGALKHSVILEDLAPFEDSPGHVEPDEIPADRLGE